MNWNIARSLHYFNYDKKTRTSTAGTFPSGSARSLEEYMIYIAFNPPLIITYLWYVNTANEVQNGNIAGTPECMIIFSLS